MITRKATAQGKPGAKSAPYRKFKVSFEIEGRMVDKDTPIGMEALEDFVNMSCPRDLKIERLRVKEVPD